MEKTAYHSLRLKAPFSHTAREGIFPSSLNRSNGFVPCFSRAGSWFETLILECRPKVCQSHSDSEAVRHHEARKGRQEGIKSGHQTGIRNTREQNLEWRKCSRVNLTRPQTGILVCFLLFFLPISPPWECIIIYMSLQHVYFWMFYMLKMFASFSNCSYV